MHNSTDYRSLAYLSRKPTIMSVLFRFCSFSIHCAAWRSRCSNSATAICNTVSFHCPSDFLTWLRPWHCKIKHSSSVVLSTQASIELRWCLPTSTFSRPALRYASVFLWPLRVCSIANHIPSLISAMTTSYQHSKFPPGAASLCRKCISLFCISMRSRHVFSLQNLCA